MSSTPSSRISADMSSIQHRNKFYDYEKKDKYRQKQKNFSINAWFLPIFVVVFITRGLIVMSYS